MKIARVLVVALPASLALGLAQPAPAQKGPERKRAFPAGCGACLGKGVFRASPLPNAPTPDAVSESSIPRALEMTRTGIVFRSIGSLPFVPPTQLMNTETPTQFIPYPGDPANPGGLVHESSIDPLVDGLSVWVEVEVQTGMSAAADRGDAVGASYVVWVEEDTNGDGAFSCGAGDSCGYLAQNPGFFGTVAVDPLYSIGGPFPADGSVFYTQAYPSLRHYFRASRRRHRVRVDGSCSNYPWGAAPTSSCIFDYSVMKVSSGVAAP